MPNRLKNEVSLHLQQHSGNPVDWFPWGKEAFDIAKRDDKPVFLSIGYSTCHWCHVMERETFSDPRVAQVLNAHFVNVKVDREERPDVDRVFIAFLQATIGHGGWPMNIFLTPELRPIFGATFIPAKAPPPHQGFLPVVEDFVQRWRDSTGRLHLRAQADDIARKMAQTAHLPPIKREDIADFFLPASADRVLLKCLDDFEAAFDGRFGGFDTKPKFPTPSVFHFLANVHCRLLERVRQFGRKFLADGGLLEPEPPVSSTPEVDLPFGDPNREVTEEDVERAQQMRSEAQALAAEGKLEEAVATITRAVLANSCSAVLYAVRGELLLRQGHVAAAIRDCDEAIRISPVAARPWKVRGKARMKVGRWEEAAMDLAKANQIDYDDDTYALLKELQADKVPKAVERRKRLEQQQQIGITEAKATHCLHMMLFTLHCISQGGLCDQLGGGFARYSLDEFWHVPRFEKMLSDNAQLVITFALAFQVDHRPLFAKSIRDTLAYVQRELAHPEGGFYTAQDADSEEVAGSGQPKEGAFYVWTHEEVAQVVRGIHPRVMDIVPPALGIKPGGNVPPHSDPAGQLHGKNVLFLEVPLEKLAQDTRLPLSEVAAVLEQCKARLLERRNSRPQPARDEKILVGFNGLMISAFARAALALGDSTYSAAARKSLTYVRQRGYAEASQELLHCCGGAGAALPAVHTDYAYFIQGLLDTYTAVGNPAMLKWAEQLQVKVEQLFGDPTGPYYDSVADPALPVRIKEDNDGADPSPNSVSAGNLWRLGHMLQRADLLERGRTVIASLKPVLLQHPKSCSQLMAALSLYSQPGMEVVVMGDPTQPAVQKLLAPLHAILFVRKVVTFYDPAEALFRDVAYLKGLSQQKGLPTAFVFEDWTLRGTATSGEELMSMLTALNVA
eukprot:GGOE01019020.1.p1 GENE.GGOE01019020.1~~GGOE01019020.1.p1  ORF type:complete len:902 (+),score=267.20 GGOE01019020.1:76-2781(+)